MNKRRRKKAFQKYVEGRPLTQNEQRAVWVYVRRETRSGDPVRALRVTSLVLVPEFREFTRSAKMALVALERLQEVSGPWSDSLNYGVRQAL